MLRKLTEEKQAEILEAGVSEFAEHGFYQASMGNIAGRAGISVGVLYKYYADKEQFFLACLKKSIDVLEQVLAGVAEPEDELLVYADRVIRALQKHAKEQADCIRMYNRLAAGGGPGMSDLAEQIEGISARLYTSFIETARRDGSVRQDIDPKIFAFFFDNLLMMLQFSYACDYYKERFQIYCGEEILKQDDDVRKELLKFLGAVFRAEGE